MKRLVRLNIAVAASAVLVVGAGVVLAFGGPHRAAAPAVPPQPASSRNTDALAAVRAELAASVQRADSLRAAINRAQAEIRLGADASRGSAPAHAAPAPAAVSDSAGEPHGSVQSASPKPKHIDATRPTASPSRSDDDGSGGDGGDDG